MFNLIFDKNLATEITLPVKRTYEHLTAEKFNASSSFDPADAPELSGMIGRTSFTTLDLETAEGDPLPITGTYNTIEDLTINSAEEEGSPVCGFSILLGYIAPPQAAE